MRYASAGLTLVSTLVYIGLLAIITVMLARLTTNLIHTNTQAQLAGEVVDNARSALNTLTQEIQQAGGVYTPTSVFNTNPGQLSVVTTQNLPTDENITYVDFYVDDEHLYIKREGEAPAQLTSQRVKVTNWQFTHLNPDSNQSAIRLAATFVADVPAADIQAQTAVTFNSTIALRTY